MHLATLQQHITYTCACVHVAYARRHVRARALEGRARDFYRFKYYLTSSKIGAGGDEKLRILFMWPNGEPDKTYIHPFWLPLMHALSLASFAQLVTSYSSYTYIIAS